MFNAGTASGPHRCPICDGRGLMPLSFYSVTLDSSATTNNYLVSCRSCNGQGIVWPWSCLQKPKEDVQ